MLVFRFVWYRFSTKFAFSRWNKPGTTPVRLLSDRALDSVVSIPERRCYRRPKIGAQKFIRIGPTSYKQLVPTI